MTDRFAIIYLYDSALPKQKTYLLPSVSKTWNSILKLSIRMIIDQVVAVVFRKYC